MGKNLFLKGLALSGVGATVTTMTITFYSALFNNNQYLVTINSLGEANVEALIVVPFSLISFLYLFYNWLREVGQRNEL